MAKQQPDILFIVLDTLRRDRLSAYGYEVETSPHFDAFASDATLFERAIAPAQWTVPSHGSLFTGEYPSTHRLVQSNESLSDAYPTMAELLRLAQYHTVAFCNNPLVGILNNGLQKGFDHFYNYAGATPNRPIDMTRAASYLWAKQQLQRVARRVTNQFSHRDWLFQVSLSPLVTPVWTRLANFTGNTTQSIDDLIGYWDAYHQGGSQQPLFSFVNLMGAHLPYRPPRNVLRHIAPDVADDRQAYRYMARFNADPGAWLSPTEAPMADWQSRTLDAFYTAEIAYQDEQVGRLLTHLRQRNQLDDTVVVILADHGEGHGDHHFIGHSFVVYQELVHVPLVIRYPARFPAGRRVKTNISTRRLFHTMMELAGAEHPDVADVAEGLYDLSLTHSLNGHPDPENGVAWAEAFPPQTLLNALAHRQPEAIDRFSLRQVRRGLYVDDYKLATVGHEHESTQLFDLARDPFETDDQAQAQPQRVAQLQADLQQRVATAESRRRAHAPSMIVDEVTAESLRALGYWE